MITFAMEWITVMMGLMNPVIQEVKKFIYLFDRKQTGFVTLLHVTFMNVETYN